MILNSFCKIKKNINPKALTNQYIEMCKMDNVKEWSEIKLTPPFSRIK